MELGTPFWEFVGCLGPENVSFVMLVSKLLFLMSFLGRNQDVQDWKTKHFARDVLQKSTFAEVGILPGSIFHDFGWHCDHFPCGP